MNYSKCDENLGMMLDRFGAENAIFLFFKDGNAYFDPKVSRPGNCAITGISEACTASGNASRGLPDGVAGNWAWTRRSTPAHTSA